MVGQTPTTCCHLCSFRDADSTDMMLVIVYRSLTLYVRNIASPKTLLLFALLREPVTAWHLQPTSLAPIGNRVPKTCHLFYNMSLAASHFFIVASDANWKHHTITSSCSNANSSNEFCEPGSTNNSYCKSLAKSIFPCQNT